MEEGDDSFGFVLCLEGGFSFCGFDSISVCLVEIGSFCRFDMFLMWAIEEVDLYFVRAISSPADCCIIFVPISSHYTTHKPDSTQRKHQPRIKTACQDPHQPTPSGSQSGED